LTPIAKDINTPPKILFLLAKNKMAANVKHSMNASPCKFPTPSIITKGLRKYQPIYSGFRFTFFNNLIPRKNTKISPIK